MANLTSHRTNRAPEDVEALDRDIPSHLHGWGSGAEAVIDFERTVWDPDYRRWAINVLSTPADC